MLPTSGSKRKIEAGDDLREAPARRPKAHSVSSSVSSSVDSRTDDEVDDESANRKSGILTHASGLIRLETTSVQHVPNNQHAPSIQQAPSI